MIYHRFYYIVNDREDLLSRFNRCYTVLRKDHYSFWENCSCDVDNFKMIYSIFSDECNEEIDIELRFVSRDDMPLLSKFSSQVIGFDPNSPVAGMDCFVRKTNEIISKEELAKIKCMPSEPELRYLRSDIINTKEIWDKILQLPTITKVISREPATIVFWKDGTKTVVKCQEGDTYDLEKGILYAILRKVYGEGRNYTDVLNVIDESCENYNHKKANEAFWNYGKED